MRFQHGEEAFFHSLALWLGGDTYRMGTQTTNQPLGDMISHLFELHL